MLIAALVAGAIGLAVGALAAWATARDRCRREVAEIAAKSGADIAATSARLDEWSKTIAALDAELRSTAASLNRTEAEASALREERTRLATRLDADRRAAAEKLALLEQTEVRLREAFERALGGGAAEQQPVVPRAREGVAGRVPAGRARATSRSASRRSTSSSSRSASRSTRSTRSCSEVEKARVERLRRRSPSRCDRSAHTAAPPAETCEPGEGAARADRARPLGRDPAPPRGRDGGHARALRLLEQQTTTTEDGRLRPDLIVRLPGGKHVVVDAKAPLDAYLDALEAQDDADARRAARATTRGRCATT